MNFDLLEPQQGDNLDAARASLAANGRSGSVVEGLVGRSDLISRGDSRGAASTVLIVSLLGRMIAKLPETNGGGKVDTNLVMVVGVVELFMKWHG